MDSKEQQSSASGSQKPSANPSSRLLSPPSLMVRKFQSDCEGISSPKKPHPRSSKHYFFYGTLMDPSKLQEVIGIKELPVLQPASMIGYKIMLFGPYPALVFEAGTPVKGMVWDTSDLEDKVIPEIEERLKAYETSRYRVAGCMIQIQGKEENPVLGKTFVWKDGTEGLKEGTFDLTEWQKTLREWQREWLTMSADEVK